MELNKAIGWIVDMRSANMEHSLAIQVGIVLYNQMKELEKKAQGLMRIIRQREINLNLTEQRNRELEVRQDELIKELCETIAYHINPIKPPPPGMALALWKIKQPVIGEAKK